MSAWALVASSLAIKDAGIDLNQVDRSRVAVVFATAFGCVELTEAFYLSAAANGWNGTDPTTFPETLPSAPASHVSMFHGLRGPNVTVSNKHFAGENALIQAASLLRHGQADLAIVLAGDALAQTLYSWYEVAGLLSPACYNSDPLPEAARFYPQRRCSGIGDGIVRPRSDPLRRSLLCPNPLGPLGGRRSTSGDHPANARRFRPESDSLQRKWCALRHQSYNRIGSRDFRRWRRYHTPAAVCPGFGRYGRSFSLDPGVKQPAQQQPAQQWASPVVGEPPATVDLRHSFWSCFEYECAHCSRGIRCSAQR